MIYAELGELELSLGNAAAARERFDAAAASSFRVGRHRRRSSGQVAGEIEALIALDRLDEARERLGEFRR